MTPALLAAFLTLSNAAPETSRGLVGDALADHARALAADEACALFSPARRSALEAGLRQIRDDLEGAGMDPGRIDAAIARARADRALLDCESELVHRLAEGVEARLGAYDHLYALEFRGRRRSWNAARLAAHGDGWPVRQEFGALRFGWRSEDGQPAVVLEGSGDAAPAAAVLVMRDPGRAAAPVDATAGGLIETVGDPLSHWGPPGDAETRIWSAGRVKPAAGADGETADFALAFPPDTLARIARLAPREGVRIELKDGNGRTYRTAWLEVGALRAALDFVIAER
ncbi:hypothetical protein DDZ18_09920 [Marinicauda salina]|uniref:Uncharacterized protein n=1 Tax=Marinicauda salina TaxID=2135793 RepID=A0A2U2BSP3_9PROT|nr:hypothetical protein [Marinicauda salina]PWE17012.1 hypothetical protein DDZ18_09920 [Marinicauda salina]